jgi:DNA repair photolyase
VTLRPVSNPPNPWLSSEVEYFGEAPEAKLEIFEDHTKKILASNDSPDVGFDYSVNPYRGCQHACAYCLDGDTLVLMGDATTKPLRDLRVGDITYGTQKRGEYRRYVRTQVLAHWSSLKAAYRVRLEDGTEIIASRDHRFLTARGWKYVTGAEQGPLQRPHLTTNSKLMGFGALPAPLAESEDYKRGYLSGMIRGDGSLQQFRYARAGRSHGNQYHFRLALVDLEALRRVRQYLLDVEIETHDFQFQAATATRREIVAIRTHARSHFERISALIEWPTVASSEWDRGFLAGIFDAEGSCSCGILRITNTDERIIAETVRCLRAFGFDCVVEPPRANAVASNVRLLGGLQERLRFFQLTQIAISRKRDFEGRALKGNAKLGVTAIEALGFEMPMFDITTGTGDFIANGVVSHNCYARPGHEYLSFGAGTDFDRKIVVKPRAPELLREAFDAKSWKGELVVFSGVTDCYQPVEASYRLTRGCLEVCADYRNPVGIITKAPLIERDIDVLQRLNEVTRLGVTISIPFWDPEHARAIEPYVATPQRRIKTIQRLAEAGLNVGVNVAPMIPGLGDQDIAEILTAAAAAGARRAALIFLRLPGPVKDVFVERIRASLPLRAERILSRVRETRGGKLNESRWGKRQEGVGQYAAAAQALFDTTCRRLGLNVSHMGDEDNESPNQGDHVDDDDKTGGPRPTTFLRPPKSGDQMKLFGDG